MGQIISCSCFWWIPPSLLRQSVFMKQITLIICHLACTSVLYCLHCQSCSGQNGLTGSSWVCGNMTLRWSLKYSSIRQSASQMQQSEQLFQDFQTLCWCFWFFFFFWQQDFFKLIHTSHKAETLRLYAQFCIVLYCGQGPHYSGLQL